MKLSELLKNPEIRRQLALYAAVTVLFAAGMAFLHPAAAALMLAAGSLFCLLALLFHRKRYEALARLSDSVNRVLHHAETETIEASEEGELAILSSDIQKMALRLQEQAGQLREDKLRMSDAVADISHQLRTPLTSLNLTVSLLENPDVPPERRLKLTRDLKTSLGRIDRLIEALLKMAKLDAGAVTFRRERLSVSALVREAARPLMVPMELRGQALVVETGDTGFDGDRLWCAEALGNLLKNCMEHTPSGGTVTVRAEETALYTRITVRDNGEGFDPEDLPLLFNRFHKGKNALPGSIGIGLALAQAVIAAQDGTIKAENAPEGGAMFTVTFYKGVI